MATKQVRMRAIALVTSGLAIAALFAFSLVLQSGKGGTWAFPTFLTFMAIVAVTGFVLLIRAQFTHDRDD